MKLHLIRKGAPAGAAEVISAQQAAGEEVALVLIGGAPKPAVDAPSHAVDDAEWARVVELIFQADNTAVW
ncbi:MAG: hypothetical protein OEY97_08780 [Nitrospirota bacterium]|nr:hypothetical protein [Nitrospirota bacterium]